MTTFSLAFRRASTVQRVLTLAAAWCSTSNSFGEVLIEAQRQEYEEYAGHRSLQQASRELQAAWSGTSMRIRLIHSTDSCPGVADPIDDDPMVQISAAPEIEGDQFVDHELFVWKSLRPSGKPRAYRVCVCDSSVAGILCDTPEQFTTSVGTFVATGPVQATATVPKASDILASSMLSVARDRTELLAPRIPARDGSDLSLFDLKVDGGILPRDRIAVVERSSATTCGSAAAAAAPVLKPAQFGEPLLQGLAWPNVSLQNPANDSSYRICWCRGNFTVVEEQLGAPIEQSAACSIESEWLIGAPSGSLNVGVVGSFEFENQECSWDPCRCIQKFDHNSSDLPYSSAAGWCQACAFDSKAPRASHGCFESESSPGQPWCYVLDGAACAAAQHSLLPDEVRKWRQCEVAVENATFESSRDSECDFWLASQVRLLLGVPAQGPGGE
jgi:hypothetical protein